MRKDVVASVSLAFIAVAGGAPMYRLLDSRGRFTPALRGRPWPLVVLVLLMAFGLGRLALAAETRPARWWAIGGMVVAFLSLAALVAAVRAAR